MSTLLHRFVARFRTARHWNYQTRAKSATFATPEAIASLPHQGRRGVQAQTRGVATVEAIVVLPVFVILFVGIYFVRDLEGAKLAADAEARRCAWVYSMDGCGDSPPAGCDAMRLKPNLAPSLEDISTKISAQAPGANASGLVGKIYDIIASTVLEKLADALSKTGESRKSIELDRPGLFGGGKVQMAGKYRLACNINRVEHKGLLDQAWSAIMP
jgi:hypothetical protein